MHTTFHQFTKSTSSSPVFPHHPLWTIETIPSLISLFWALPGPCQHGRTLRDHVDLCRQRPSWSLGVGPAESQGRNACAKGQGKTSTLWRAEHGRIFASSQAGLDPERHHFSVGEVRWRGRWDDGMMDECVVRQVLRYWSFLCINMGLVQLRQYAFNQALWWWVSCHCSTKSFCWALFSVVMRYHKVLQAKHQVSEIVKKEAQTSGPDHLGSSAGAWVTMAYCNSRWGWERSQWLTWAACFVQCNLMAPQGWINASKQLGRRASPIRPLGSEWVGQRELDTYQIITYLWSSMTLASLKR